ELSEGHVHGAAPHRLLIAKGAASACHLGGGAVEARDVGVELAEIRGAANSALILIDKHQHAAAPGGADAHVELIELAVVRTRGHGGLHRDRLNGARLTMFHEFQVATESMNFASSMSFALNPPAS